MSVRDLERLSQDVKSDVIVKGTSSSKKDLTINIECMKI